MTRDDRLLAFGDELRQLRKAAQFTGQALAKTAGWQPSKVSRLENGQQVITEQDLSTWCAIVGASDETRSALRDELRGMRLDQAQIGRAHV